MGLAGHPNLAPIPKVVSQAHIDPTTTPEKDMEKALDTQARHKRFLERTPGSTTSSFRPKKRHRASVEKMLGMLDNQAIPMFGGGTSQVVYDPGGGACSSWCFRPSRTTDRGFLPCPPQTRHTHRQVRVSTSFGGLVGFKPNASQGELPHWKSWNHITVASDQGADMVSGVFSLMYMSSIKCNVTAFFDVSHGATETFGALSRRTP